MARATALLAALLFCGLAITVSAAGSGKDLAVGRKLQQAAIVPSVDDDSQPDGSVLDDDSQPAGSVLNDDSAGEAPDDDGAGPGVDDDVPGRAGTPADDDDATAPAVDDDGADDGDDEIAPAPVDDDGADDGDDEIAPAGAATANADQAAGLQVSSVFPAAAAVAVASLLAVFA